MPVLDCRPVSIVGLWQIVAQNELFITVWISKKTVISVFRTAVFYIYDFFIVIYTGKISNQNFFGQGTRF